MYKGQLAQSNLIVQLAVLLLLVLIGMFFFSLMGIVAASLIYGISLQDVYFALQDFESAQSAEVFKLIQGISTLGSFLVPALFGAWLFSENPEKMLGTISFPKPVWLILILILLAASGMGALSDLLVRASSSVPLPEALQSYLQESQDRMVEIQVALLQMKNPIDYIKVLIVMALLPAVAEEALFRGVVQPLFRRKFNTHLAVIITSFIFAFVHQQFLGFLSIFALGCLLGYLKEWSVSIWPSTILHFINNAGIVSLVYFAELDYQQELETQGGINWMESSVLLAIFLVSVLLLEYLLRRNRSLDQL